MRCKHSDVCITPTYETAWGLEDKYNIVCIDCKQILYSRKTNNELNDIITIEKFNVIFGKKYL